MRRRLMIHEGEQFSPAALDEARQDLMGLGVFSTVRMDPAGQLDPQGNLPITVELTERKLHSVDMGVAYSTDLGFNVNAGWHHRNLFGNAEQLNLTGSVQLGGSAVTEAGLPVRRAVPQARLPGTRPAAGARPHRAEAEPEGLRPDGADRTGAAHPQVLAALDRQRGLAGRAGTDHPAGYRDAVQPAGRADRGALRQHEQPAGPDDGHPRELRRHADPVAWRQRCYVLRHAGIRLDLHRPQRRRAQRRRAARPGGQGGRGRRVQPAARPALLCRRQRHGARLPLPVGRAAVRGQHADRRQCDSRRNDRAAPAHPRQLRGGRVRRCRPGHRQWRAVHQHLAGRRRCGLADTTPRSGRSARTSPFR